MTNTILITGASSGIGKATAKFFQEKGWNIITTMRTPEKESELTRLDNVLVIRLDVTDSSSIDSAVAEGMEKFGQIDVLLNKRWIWRLRPARSLSGGEDPPPV